MSSLDNLRCPLWEERSQSNFKGVYRATASSGKGARWQTGGEDGSLDWGL